MGGILVSEQEDRSLTRWRDDINSLFPQRAARDIHFYKLKHEQKIAAASLLASKPFGACVILSNKATIVTSSKYEVFKQPQHLYNYLVRFLLERLTVACRKHAAREGHSEASLTVTFSRRTGTDYQVMNEYLMLMKQGKEVLPSIRSIDWSVFDPADIRVENHAVRAGLQIADVITSATYAAFEPSTYGHCETGYSEQLRSRYIKEDGCALNCGLTLIPLTMDNPMPDSQREFALSFK